MSAATAITSVSHSKTHHRGRRYIDQVVGDHVVTTDIIERIKKATPGAELLVNVLVSRAIAQDLMTLNSGNRPVHKAMVSEYADEMTNDEWEFTGQTIRISKNMKLQDCQHQLLAIIESGRAQRYHIQCGLKEKAFNVIDIGRRRSAGDILAMRGYTGYTTMAASIKAEIYFRVHQKVGASIYHNRVTNQDIINWLDTQKVDRMIKCIDHSNTVLHKTGKFISASTWAFVYYTLMNKSATDATKFCELLANGEGLSKTNNSPIFFLRERLLSFQRSKFDPIGKRHIDLKIRYIITAWNLWREGKKIQSLHIDTKATTIVKPI